MTPEQIAALTLRGLIAASPAETQAAIAAASAAIQEIIAAHGDNGRLAIALAAIEIAAAQ